MRLLVISHSLVQRASQVRWRRMAADNLDVHIRLLIPRRWVSRWFGNEVVFENQDESAGNFEVKTVDVTSEENFSIYFVNHFRREIRSFAPDAIFPVHEGYQLAQCVIWRKCFAPHARLLFFTMGINPRNTKFRLYLHHKRMLFESIDWIRWRLTRIGTDAAMCHYPGIEQQIRKDGYRRPVLIQTQLGVDEEMFHPNPLARAKVRAELGLEGFVVGFAGRVTVDKGVIDIANAMVDLPPDVRLLVVGDGLDRTRLEDMATQAGWRDRLLLTGYVPVNEVARLMRAMDCFVLGSRSTATWTDTFPLVVAQAMATGLPVVGSDSGAIPFQLGGQGLIFHEGDVKTMVRHIRNLYADTVFRNKVGQALLNRAREEFCIAALNPKLLSFIKSLART